MERKRKLTLPDGREVEGSIIGFRGVEEPWSEYLLDDGTVLRIRGVATEVLRIDDEYDPVGNPIYLMQSTNVMSVSAPENLRRKGPGG